jgi:DNA-binding response OmpR family regulator
MGHAAGMVPSPPGQALSAACYSASTRPATTSGLVVRIRALARRRPAAASRVYRAAGVELDPLRRTVTRDGEQIALSAKEFGVLEALLRAAPSVVSPEALLEQVWDENADPFTKTVQVTMGRLRRKLGEPPVIQTIPGAGYRIADAPSPDRRPDAVRGAVGTPQFPPIR